MPHPSYRLAEKYLAAILQPRQPLRLPEKPQEQSAPSKEEPSDGHK